MGLLISIPLDVQIFCTMETLELSKFSLSEGWSYSVLAPLIVGPSVMQLDQDIHSVAGLFVTTFQAILQTAIGR